MSGIRKYLHISFLILFNTCTLAVFDRDRDELLDAVDTVMLGRIKKFLNVSIYRPQDCPVFGLGKYLWG
jgi:hypothetical protein